MQNHSAPHKHKPLLTVNNLGIGFTASTPGAPPLPAVEGVSFSLHKGETLCLVGESGCGKSITAKAIIGLLHTPPAHYLSGSIEFEGQSLLSLPAKDMQRIRGNRMGMVFQEPMTSLNPVMRIGAQVTEPLAIHRGHTTASAKSLVIAMLHAVGLPAPERCYEQYPHELSGGMRQRVMIAQALICQPQLVLADEPTTALDVTMQQQILALLKQLAKEHNTALLLITHDFTVVSCMADQVAVMYAGQLVEKAPAAMLLHNPQHPYTQGLLASRPPLKGHPLAQQSVPTHNGFAEKTEPRQPNMPLCTATGAPKSALVIKPQRRLPAIAGTVPSLAERPTGCLFHPRCPHAMPRCQKERPHLTPIHSVTQAHLAACWLVNT